MSRLGVVLQQEELGNIGEFRGRGWNAANTTSLAWGAESHCPHSPIATRVPTVLLPPESAWSSVSHWIVLDAGPASQTWCEMRTRSPGWILAQQKAEQNLRLPCPWISSFSLNRLEVALTPTLISIVSPPLSEQGRPSPSKQTKSSVSEPSEPNRGT